MTKDEMNDAISKNIKQLTDDFRNELKEDRKKDTIWIVVMSISVVASFVIMHLLF